MSNAPEFGWDYPQNRSAPGGGGRQWLHSNQANTAYMQSSGSQGSGQNAYASPGHPYASPSDPFASYNQSMMDQFTNFSPYGHSEVGASMVNGTDLDLGIHQSIHQGMSQGMGNRNGQGNMARGNMARGTMAQGTMARGTMAQGQRLSGGNTGRSNGLNDPNPAQAHRGSWF